MVEEKKGSKPAKPTDVASQPPAPLKITPNVGFGSKPVITANIAWEPAKQADVAQQPIKPTDVALQLQTSITTVATLPKGPYKTTEAKTKNSN
jgi:hypothetical protein